MSLSGVRKLLKRMGFKPRRKIKTNFVSKKNKPLRLTWAKKHHHFTVDQWRQWVFSDETRANSWGPDGNSYYWSSGGDILQPYQTEPHVEGDGGSTSLLDTLEYYDMNPDLNPIEHVWYQLKRRLNTYPTRPTTKEELEARITSE
ncbi:hypothetical protein INT46_001089 [Mucor plumbeus]|uniref:Transposase n=1 Tax=Mucor plumbeus TaxID=97098 RepID=A0A8H7QKZ8_9FUNG|nr:hypothetical protein INT46_001089 [Mucor plumbeus]